MEVLACGSLLMLVSLAQAATRPGFDLQRHGVRMLSLGDVGGIQVLNFVVCGALNVARATGVRRASHPGACGTLGPVRLGGFGLGLTIGGLFTTNPALAFPPGTPDGMPTGFSWHPSYYRATFMRRGEAMPRRDPLDREPQTSGRAGKSDRGNH
jgi:Protein of unknown function (DUF998)